MYIKKQRHKKQNLSEKGKELSVQSFRALTIFRFSVIITPDKTLFSAKKILMFFLFLNENI